MNYWQECIEIAFEEAEIKASREQIEHVAASVQISHECEGMASGRDAIPPLRSFEIDNLKKRIVDLEKERDEAILDFKKNVAARHRCDPADVHLEGNGHAKVYR